MGVLAISICVSLIAANFAASVPDERAVTIWWQMQNRAGH